MAMLTNQRVIDINCFTHLSALELSNLGTFQNHTVFWQKSKDVFLNLFHKHPQPNNFDMNCKWQTS